MNDRPLVQQVPLFAVVGALATLTHVAAALAVRELAGFTPLQANFVGYLAAVGVSYLGNARLTFRRRALHGPQFAAPGGKARLAVLGRPGRGGGGRSGLVVRPRPGLGFPRASLIESMPIPT